MIKLVKIKLDKNKTKKECIKVFKLIDTFWDAYLNYIKVFPTKSVHPKLIQTWLHSIEPFFMGYQQWWYFKWNNPQLHGPPNTIHSSGQL